eukprot:Rhum_TRINITY_DN22803_c0_g1::Rhum_TRINITY_DN22803_c0_g1_i1::g.176108::m.176108
MQCIVRRNNNAQTREVVVVCSSMRAGSKGGVVCPLTRASYVCGSLFSGKFAYNHHSAFFPISSPSFSLGMYPVVAVMRFSVCLQKLMASRKGLSQPVVMQYDWSWSPRWWMLCPFLVRTRWESISALANQCGLIWCDCLWNWLVSATRSESERQYTCHEYVCGTHHDIAVQLVSIGARAIHSSVGTQSMKLSPFVSTKSCLHMAYASTWCSRNERINVPNTGVSTEPHVSAPQCTSPLMKSATSDPTRRAVNPQLTTRSLSTVALNLARRTALYTQPRVAREMHTISTLRFPWLYPAFSFCAFSRRVSIAVIDAVFAACAGGGHQ